MVSEKDGFLPEELDRLERLGFEVERGSQEEEEEEEKPAKRGRGRPRLPLTENGGIVWEGPADDAYDKDRVLTHLRVDITRRQGHNIFYIHRVCQAFRGKYYDPRVNDLKGIVMTELGRLGDDAAIRYAFYCLWDEIEAGRCSHRAQDQAALLRSWRREGGLPMGTVEGLKKALEDTYAHYQAQHRGIASEHFIEALASLYWVWKGELEK